MADESPLSNLRGFGMISRLNERQLLILNQERNRDKGCWRGADLGRLLELLYDEVKELNVAVHLLGTSQGSTEEVISEAADVANFAAMIADNARELTRSF
jgi:hypothetical protein